MKRKPLKLKCVNFIFLSLLFINLYSQTSKLEIIRNAIKEKGAKWHAQENWVTKLPENKRQKLYGFNRSELRLLKGVNLIVLPPADNLPDSLDWRKNGGNWVSPVRNQGTCGSCWAFSAVAQVESWWKIFNNKSYMAIDFSEQLLLSSGSAGSCGGGSVTAALNFIKVNGIPPEWCMTYQATDTIPLADACADWKEHAVKIPGWGFISGPDASVENIKNALMFHPVSASYTIYEDFNYYSGGVYEHVWGKDKGGHAILIVGWNDADSAWICKNSWGQYWGENGYFRIKWGQCGIGEYSPFIWNGTSLPGDMAVLTDTLRFELSKGGSEIKQLTVQNTGSEVLEYSAVKSMIPVVFHPDTFNAKQGSSWWCGDADVGGYKNHWLQYLDTPVIDLTGTSNPVLKFDGFWKVEDPAGTDPPWDGWDGCNVWISTDGGESFNVINPVSPDYTCQHLWSFGHPEQGWNLGENIAGWAGSSSGWLDVSFDLSQYKNESQVVVRWAFASDKGFSTPDDSSMIGYFIDNIRIGDENSPVFINNGDDFEEMSASGFGSDSAPWISIENGVGRIESGEIYNVNVSVDTKELQPGDYLGRIEFSTNSDTEQNLSVPVKLKVIPGISSGVNTDLKNVPVSIVLGQNYPNPFNSSTIISYSINAQDQYRMLIFDVKGKLVRNLFSTYKNSGNYTIKWDGKDDFGKNVSSGLYLLVLKSKRTIKSIKMMYLR